MLQTHWKISPMSAPFFNIKPTLIWRATYGEWVCRYVAFRFSNTLSWREKLKHNNAILNKKHYVVNPFSISYSSWYELRTTHLLRIYTLAHTFSDHHRFCGFGSFISHGSEATIKDSNISHSINTLVCPWFRRWFPILRSLHLNMLI